MENIKQLSSPLQKLEQFWKPARKELDTHGCPQLRIPGFHCTDAWLQASAIIYSDSKMTHYVLNGTNSKRYTSLSQFHVIRKVV